MNFESRNHGNFNPSNSFPYKPIIRRINYIPDQFIFVSDVLMELSGKVLEIFTRLGVLVKIHDRNNAQHVEVLKFRATETVYELAFIAPRNYPNNVTLCLYQHTDRYTSERGERTTVMTVEFKQPFKIKSVLEMVETIVSEYMITNPMNLRHPKARFVVEMDKPTPASRHVGAAFKIFTAALVVVDNEPSIQLGNEYGNVVKHIPITDSNGREVQPQRLIGQYFIFFAEGDHLIKNELIFKQNFIRAGEQPASFNERDHFSSDPLCDSALMRNFPNHLQQTIVAR